eukprot:TRINITY_DN2599_c0_g1_i1.p1 TRINITY_DN2599_c0_g1~~TRINITY_DN2599_c0_g1_i1.p1  ORF type:complete len:674 (+),score=126.10 TRINITY_DN2599_c0_g1_i1:688-2709(+)
MTDISDIFKHGSLQTRYEKFNELLDLLLIDDYDLNIFFECYPKILNTLFGYHNRYVPNDINTKTNLRRGIPLGDSKSTSESSKSWLHSFVSVNDTKKIDALFDPKGKFLTFLSNFSNNNAFRFQMTVDVNELSEYTQQICLNCAQYLYNKNTYKANFPLELQTFLKDRFNIQQQNNIVLNLSAYEYFLYKFIRFPLKHIYMKDKIKTVYLKLLKSWISHLEIFSNSEPTLLGQFFFDLIGEFWFRFPFHSNMKEVSVDLGSSLVFCIVGLFRYFVQKDAFEFFLNYNMFSGMTTVRTNSATMTLHPFYLAIYFPIIRMVYNLCLLTSITPNSIIYRLDILLSLLSPWRLVEKLEKKDIWEKYVLIHLQMYSVGLHTLLRRLLQFDFAGNKNLAMLVRRIFKSFTTKISTNNQTAMEMIEHFDSLTKNSIFESKTERLCSFYIQLNQQHLSSICTTPYKTLFSTQTESTVKTLMNNLLLASRAVHSEKHFELFTGREPNLFADASLYLANCFCLDSPFSMDESDFRPLIEEDHEDLERKSYIERFDDFTLTPRSVDSLLLGKVRLNKKEAKFLGDDVYDRPIRSDEIKILVEPLKALTRKVENSTGRKINFRLLARKNLWILALFVVLFLFFGIKLIRFIVDGVKYANEQNSRYQNNQGQIRTNINRGTTNYPQ